MPPLRTFKTGLTGAIGCDFVPTSGTAVFVDYNAGTIQRIDVAAGTVTVIGSGYGLLEDIVVAPNGRAYVTERQGTLYSVDLANANRASAQVVGSGLTAPQRVALSIDGNRAYIVEYRGAGRLLRYDLTAPGAQPVELLANLQEAVGLAVSADERFAYVGEQAGAGTVSRFALDATRARTQLVSGVPAPFFIRWADARRSSFFLPLRDPHDRVVKVSLARPQPSVTTVLGSVPFRPSSVAVLPYARLLVCSDAEVGEWALPTVPGMRMAIRGIVYDPPGPDVPRERIVLQNDEDEFVDLSGWTVRDAANHVYTFVDGFALPAGDVVRLWTKTGPGGPADIPWNRNAAVWNNTPGDVARLSNAQGVDVATYSYATPSAPTTPGAVTSVGIGGGGAMYSPVVSPNDRSVMFVCCDMGGLYRSQNGGTTWQLLDANGMAVSAEIDRSSGARLLPPKPIAFRQESAWQNVIAAWGRYHGLRYSLDLGGTWTDIPLAAGWASENVTALGVDANGRLFVGTENGAHYHDPAPNGGWGGLAWGTCAGISGWVVGFVLVPDPAQTRFAATRGEPTTSGTVYRSSNGGASWVDVDTLGSTSPLARTLSGNRRRINDLGGGGDAAGRTLYVTMPTVAGAGAGVHVSANDGQDWTRTTGGLDLTNGGNDVQFERLAVSPNNRNLAYVSAQGTTWPEVTNVYRTTNAGGQWTSIYGAGTIPRGWLELNRQGFGGPPVGFAASYDATAARATVLASNKGSLWKLDDDPAAPSPGWQQAYSQPDGSTPPNWASVGLEVTTVWRYEKDPHDPTRHFVCYTDIGFMRGVPQQSGARWAYDALPAWRSNAYQLAFDPDRAGTMWMAASDEHDLPYEKQQPPPTGTSSDGGVLRSDTYGATWVKQNQGLPAAPAVSIVVDPQSPQSTRQLWASMFRAGVFRSVDDGASWQGSSAGLTGGGFLSHPGFDLPSTQHPYRLELHADGTLFCALSGTNRQAGGTYVKESGLFRSSDYGGTWSLVSALYEYVLDYAVHPIDSRVIYLCTSNVRGAYGAVYRTEDGGSRWDPLLDFAGVGGATKYLDTVGFFAPFLHPLNPNVVLAASNTHGIWISSDGGTTWKAFPFPFARVHRFLLDPADPATLYVCTHGAGIQRVALSY